MTADPVGPSFAPPEPVGPPIASPEPSPTSVPSGWSTTSPARSPIARRAAAGVLVMALGILLVVAAFFIGRATVAPRGGSFDRAFFGGVPFDGQAPVMMHRAPAVTGQAPVPANPGPMMTGRSVSGTVVSLTGGSIVVQLTRGRQVTLSLDPATTIAHRDGSTATIAPGERIMITLGIGVNGPVVSHITVAGQ